MVGLVRSPRNRGTASRARWARPCLETLEGRDAPATLTLSVTYGYGKIVTLQGDLTDHSILDNQTINFSGMAQGSTTTNATGQFALTLEANGLGTVYAYAPALPANTPSVGLSDIAPTITFDAIEGSGGFWTFSGTVTYHRPFETLEVFFGGVPVSLRGQVTTADGTTSTYSFLKELTGTTSDNGMAWARARSPWGLPSEYADDLVYQSGT